MEDLDHILRQSPNAQVTWQVLEKAGMRCVASDTGLQEWIQQNIRRTHEDPEWPEKFVITMWYIWKWRCALCFDNAGEIPVEKGEFLVTKFREILNALERGSPILNAPPGECSEVWLRWEPPVGG